MKLKSLLFNKVTISQTIAKNIFWLAIATGIGRLLTLLLFIYVARILGAVEYGKFTFAMSFTSLFVILSDFGLPQIITREFSQDSRREREFSSLLFLKFILSFLALILMICGAFFVTKDILIRQLIWILSFYILIANFPEFFYSFFRARQKMEYEAFFKVLQASLISAFGFFTLFRLPSVKNLSYSYLSASFLLLILVFLFFHSKVSKLKFNLKREVWKKFLLFSWPLGLASIFTAIFVNLDSALMGHLGQMAETGWYNATRRIIDGTLILPMLIYQSFFPALSSAFVESKKKLQKIWNSFAEVMIVLALPIIIGGITLSSKIINFLYGPNYFPSILVFQILLFGVALSFLSEPLNQALIVANQQEKFLLVTFGAALANSILNIILIPRYSLYGAAISRIIALFLIFLLLFKFTFKFTPIRPFNLKFLLVFASSLISCVPMYFFISWQKICNLNILILISIGALIYLISYYGCRKLTFQFLI